MSFSSLVFLSISLNYSTFVIFICKKVVKIVTLSPVDSAGNFGVILDKKDSFYSKEETIIINTNPVEKLVLGN